MYFASFWLNISPFRAVRTQNTHNFIIFPVRMILPKSSWSSKSSCLVMKPATPIIGMSPYRAPTGNSPKIQKIVQGWLSRWQKMFKKLSRVIFKGDYKDAKQNAINMLEELSQGDPRPFFHHLFCILIKSDWKSMKLNENHWKSLKKYMYPDVEWLPDHG